MSGPLNGIEVPIRLTSSHGINRIGFSSSRRGVLGSRPPCSTSDFVPLLELEELAILEVDVARLVVRPPLHGWQLLSVSFTGSTDEPGAVSFVRSFADSLSASFAPGQMDAWHGNLFIEIDWSAFRTLRAPSGGGDALHMSDSVGIESHERKALAAADLTALRHSPFTQIFVDGMRASQPKSKLVYWFVLLEELEKRSEFDHLYGRLLSPAEISTVMAGSGLSGAKLDRLKQFLNQRNLTVEPRHEKLARILDHIGVVSVNTLKGPIPVTAELCKGLIGQRNRVAHRGSGIDEDIVFAVLMPLSHAALGWLESN